MHTNGRFNESETVAGRLRVFLYFTFLSLIAYFSVPLSTIVMGKGIQLYQFPDRAARITTYCLFSCLLLALDFVFSGIARRAPIFSRYPALGLAKK